MTERPNLTRKLELQESVATPDGAGGFDVQWTTLGELWADMRASRGRESLVGARASSSVVWRIFVRAAPFGAPSRPTPNQRFVEGSRIFTILSVAEVTGHELYLECWAEEGSLA